jgi:hypothetical protein
MTQQEHDELYRAVERGELVWGRGEKPHREDWSMKHEIFEAFGFGMAIGILLGVALSQWL